LVKHVEVADVQSRLSAGALWAGVDVGKAEALVMIRDSKGAFERPWKVKLPGEIRELVSRLQSLRSRHEITVAMESTGTYGEALRQALTDAELAVERVRSQATSDYAEIFDGVPSQHDGKDAAMLAELGAIGKSVAWPSRAVSEETALLKAQVQWLTAQQEIWQTWLGRLEGLVSKFWPEATGVVSLQSVTLLRALKEYGGPRGLAADDQAACEAGQAVKKAQKQLQALSRGQAVIERMSESVGRNTACVLFVMLGDPHDYHCGAAYRKALGLNLKERSSGKHQGQLKITKRGPSLVRRWLYFAALRWVQRGPIRRWFEIKKLFGPSPKDFERHDSDVQCASDRTVQPQQQDIRAHVQTPSLAEMPRRSEIMSSPIQT
jgi:transposase